MKERLYYFDLLRAIAIIAVIAIHVSNIGFSTENKMISNTTILFRNLMNFAVPLFIALSGYFLSEKKIDSWNTYILFISKQIKRVLIPLIIWSIIYIVYYFFKGERNYFKLLISFFTFQSNPIFYYVAVIIQCYILLPIFQLIGNHKLYLIYNLIVSLFVALVINFYKISINENVSLIIYAGNVLVWSCFFSLGIYLKKNKISISLLLISLLFILSLVETLILNKYISLSNSVTAIKFSSFIYSFCIIIYLFSKVDNFSKFNSNIIKIGELSFGIYFIHIIIMDYVIKFSISILNKNIFSQIIITLLVLFISYLIGVIIRKINPNFSKKYLGY